MDHGLSLVIIMRILLEEFRTLLYEQFSHKVISNTPKTTVLRSRVEYR